MIFLHLFWFIVIVLVPFSNSAKILGVFYSPIYSHYHAGNAMMKILAERGHEVTVMSPFTEKNPPANYKEMYLSGVLRPPSNRSFEDQRSAFSTMWIANKRAAPFLTKIMSHPQFQKLLNGNLTFDAVIVEQFVCDALFYLSKHFDAPLIGFSTLDATSWTNRYVGNPTFPSYIADVLFSFIRMNFWQRLQNIFLFLLEEILFHAVRIPYQNQILQDKVPGAPHLKEIVYNTSIVFLNADISFHDANPKVPSMINIGGFHINSPKALPADLQQVLDAASDGVIYFSLGASKKSKEMPKKQLAAFLEVFSEMNETILWKWEDDDLPGKTKNIILNKWLPQQDVLGHKNIKLFISHGGLLSILESIHNGVPMLTIPLQADQYSNAARAVAGGYAKSMQFSEITALNLRTTLNELMENPTYKKNAEQKSMVMKLKPVSPRDTIIFWVENVIKFRGAPHLRSLSLSVPWYQYFYLDIAGFILFVIVLLVLFIYFIIIGLIRIYRYSKYRRVHEESIYEN